MSLRSTNPCKSFPGTAFLTLQTLELALRTDIAHRANDKIYQLT